MTGKRSEVSSKEKIATISPEMQDDLLQRNLASLKNQQQSENWGEVEQLEELQEITIEPNQSQALIGDFPEDLVQDYIASMPEPEPEPEPTPQQSGLLSKEEWITSISEISNFAYMFTKMESHKVDLKNPIEVKGLGAIYDTIFDTKYLRFMLKPPSKWADRTLSIIMYVGMKRSQIQAEKAQKGLIQENVDFDFMPEEKEVA
jgi:hypothetical protein